MNKNTENNNKAKDVADLKELRSHEKNAKSFNAYLRKRKSSTIRHCEEPGE